MKLKQVTFAEALEHMKAGKLGYGQSITGKPLSYPYRIKDGKFEFLDCGVWISSGNSIHCALNPWFIEVEPMKDMHQTTVDASGYVNRYYIGIKWASADVNVTVEEI